VFKTSVLIGLISSLLTTAAPLPPKPSPTDIPLQIIPITVSLPRGEPELRIVTASLPAAAADLLVGACSVSWHYGDAFYLIGMKDAGAFIVRRDDFDAAVATQPSRDHALVALLDAKKVCAVPSMRMRPSV
jgi:hypothetical protein